MHFSPRIPSLCDTISVRGWVQRTSRAGQIVLVTLFAACGAEARGSCGDWLQHAAMAAPDTSDAAGVELTTPAILIRAADQPGGPVPCDGIRCGRAPQSWPPPVIDSNLRTDQCAQTPANLSAVDQRVCHGLFKPTDEPPRPGYRQPPYRPPDTVLL